MKMYAAVLFCVLIAVAFAEENLHNKNELKDTPEEKVEIIMSEVDKHCQAINSDQIGIRRKRHLDARFEALLLQLMAAQCKDHEDDDEDDIVNPTYPPVAGSDDPCTSYVTQNLTESWRLDNLGSDIRPTGGMYACDRELQGNTKWFRFTGSAGHQLANRCAPGYSCGGHGGFWSDATMPSTAGETKQVPIYGSWSGNCKWYTWPTQNPLTVKRCTERPGDFVYKVQGTSSCYWTFCGMELVN